MSLKNKALKGVFWSGLQQVSSQIISFGVSLILARLLLPEEFGLIAMIGIVLAVGKTLIEAGLTTSLIRTPNTTQADYSTVFYFNLAGSTFIYFIAFLIAPLVAAFYEQDILTDIIRVMSLSFIISALSQVQNTRLIKLMDFKTLFWVNLPATIIGGSVGIIMAYRGWGVWSLVYYNLARALVSSVQLWLYSRWMPSLIFDNQLFKKHFNFGYKLTLSGLLNTLFDNIYPIIIGKFFSPAQLGFYTRADSLKQLPVNNFSSIFSNVAFPLLSEVQEDKTRLKSTLQKIIKLSIFSIAPVLFIMAALATPLFTFLFTEKWLPAVPYFQILVISGILYPVHMYNLTILNVLGRSDLFLKLELIKKMMIVIAVVVGLQWDILGLLWASVVMSTMALILNTHYTKLFINYSLKEQVKDLAPILLCVGIASLAAFIGDIFLSERDYNDLSRLAIGSFIGLTLYLGLAYTLKLSSFTEAFTLIRSTVNQYIFNKNGHGLSS